MTEVRQLVSGRSATVSYLTSAFEPATADDFDFAKVLFDDTGDMVFLAGPDEGQRETAAFNKRRGKHRTSLADHAERRETKEESDAWLRHRAGQAPEKTVRAPTILGRTYGQWAKIMLADDISRIDIAIRTGLTEGLDNTEIARTVVGSLGLNGVDGVTEITRQRLARLGVAKIKNT